MSLGFLCIALEMKSLIQRVEYINRGLEMTRFLEGKGLEIMEQMLRIFIYEYAGQIYLQDTKRMCRWKQRCFRVDQRKDSFLEHGVPYEEGL